MKTYRVKYIFFKLIKSFDTSAQNRTLAIQNLLDKYTYLKKDCVFSVVVVI